MTFNPLRERGWERFASPQNPVQMLTGSSTDISSQYHQVKAGGDIAALTGICKLVIEEDDRAIASGGKRILDHHFIEQHTTRFEDFANYCRNAAWNDIIRDSGLTRDAIEQSARVYMKAERVIAVYGMGITQHRYGIDALHMIVNLLLLRGNIGREGAGPGPVRGHSNVQGQRTVGITEKTELAPVERLKELFEFEPPTENGWDTVEACRQIIAGTAQGFVQLGGNFLRATPEHAKMKAAWAKLPITVHIATKLNKSHLVPGEESYILPCLGRLETDMQAGGRQAVSMEDSFSHIYGSVGKATPAADTLLSEPAIVAGSPKPCWSPIPMSLGTNGSATTVWSAPRSRMSIRTSSPISTNGCSNPAASGRAIPPRIANGKPRAARPSSTCRVPWTPGHHRRGRMRLITLRSNDQFNTTIYGYDDRFRGSAARGWSR